LRAPTAAKASAPKKILGFWFIAHGHRAMAREENAREQAVGEANGHPDDHDNDQPERGNVKELGHQA
jgi:hypothetical protein